MIFLSMRKAALMAVFFFLLNLFSPSIILAGEKPSFEEQIMALEEDSGGKIGLFATDTGSGKQIGYRSQQRFPLCSTFKALLVAAILKKSVPGSSEGGEGSGDNKLLERRISYTAEDLVAWSPITEKHLGEGMIVGDLCAAAIQHSDNTAANLLLKLVNGPEGLTIFMRSMGDAVFRLDRWEPDLNSALPDDERDTSTPSNMEKALRLFALGPALPRAQKEQFQIWLKGNTTGSTAIRAGVPAGWVVGDKTGSGGYGTSNDIAVLWPPNRKPIVIAIYFTGASGQKGILAAATRIVLKELDPASGQE